VPNLPALQAYQCHLDRTHVLTNIISLIIDTGASISVTNCVADFITPLRPVQQSTLQGIAAGLAIKGLGTVRYTVKDDLGGQQVFTIPKVLYVPDCPSRLLCPRQLLASLGDPQAMLHVRSHGVQLSFSTTTISIPYHGTSYLPIMYTMPTLACYHVHCNDGRSDPASSPSPTPHVGNDSLPSLTPAQRTKLLWHRRMNRVNFDQLTKWMRDGIIPVSKAVVNAPAPVCAACHYGKAQRRTHHKSTGVIGAQHQAPGAGVSADQLEAGCPGLVPTSKGSPTTQRYHYCNVWVDHYSRFTYVTVHSTKEAKEMLASKKEFEAFCLRHGIKVKSVRADNGVYASQLFRAHCDSQAQDLTFCAVGGHWKNGIAERCIGLLQNVARTLLLQAMSQWPSKINEQFWPFAICHSPCRPLTQSFHPVQCRCFPLGIIHWGTIY
jgi:hypothetical protein